MLTSSHPAETPQHFRGSNFQAFLLHTMSEENQANGETMRVDPQRAQALAENVGSVLHKISGAAGGRQVPLA